jgi:hypothetical protein
VVYEIKSISLLGQLVHCADRETEAQRKNTFPRFTRVRSMRTQSSWPLALDIRAEDKVTQRSRAEDV